MEVCILDQGRMWVLCGEHTAAPDLHPQMHCLALLACALSCDGLRKQLTEMVAWHCDSCTSEVHG